MQVTMSSGNRNRLRRVQSRAAFHLHSNLAHLRVATGDMEGALDSMTESLRGAEELADTQGMVYALNSFAEFYLRARQPGGCPSST